MPEMQPSVGRMVLCTFGSGETFNGAAEFPAIIGQVLGAGPDGRPYCNLLVFPPFAAPCWAGSVQEFRDSDPPGNTTWRWPPRT